MGEKKEKEMGGGRMQLKLIGPECICGPTNKWAYNSMIHAARFLSIKYYYLIAKYNMILKGQIGAPFLRPNS